MGVCTNGDIQIMFQTEEDADLVYKQLQKIEELTSERIKEPAHFNLQEIHVDGDMLNCNVYADRTPNGEFQVEQVVELLRILVQEAKIQPPHSFEAELLIQHQGWSLDEENFGEDLTDR